MNATVEKLIEKLKEEEDSIQIAKIIHTLHFDKMLSLKEIASHLQKHPSYISHYLRILQLPSIVLDGYYAKQITPAHLFILSRLSSGADILKAYEEILSKGLSTTQSEELIRQIKFTVSTTNDKVSKVQMDELIESIQKAFPHVSVKVIQSRIKGKIILELKGKTEETTNFITQIADRISKKSYSEDYDDTLQVLE